MTEMSDLEREVRAALEPVVADLTYNSPMTVAFVARLVPVVVRLIEAHRAPLIRTVEELRDQEGMFVVPVAEWAAMKARAKKAEADLVRLTHEARDAISAWEDAAVEWKGHATKAEARAAELGERADKAEKRNVEFGQRMDGLASRHDALDDRIEELTRHLTEALDAAEKAEAERDHWRDLFEAANRCLGEEVRRADDAQGSTDGQR